MKSIFLGIVAFLTTATLTPQTLIQDVSKTSNDRAVLGTSMVEEIQSLEVTPAKTTTSTSSGWWRYPEDIKMVTRTGDDLLVLVNKEYKLSSTYVPSGLVSASSTGIKNGSNYMLRNIVINDLKAMVSDMKSEGLYLSMVSGYRSYNTQIGTYNHWLSYYNGSVASADKISARAGHSQHQLGTTADFSSSEIANGLSSTFANTKASAWLVKNAWKYGFVIGYPAGYESTTGYSYESWHYRYIGRENAQEMHNSGMILELYLRSKN